MERERERLERQVRDAAERVMSLNLEGIDVEGMERRAALLANLSRLQNVPATACGVNCEIFNYPPSRRS